jgi:enterobacteria phage integrase
MSPRARKEINRGLPSNGRCRNGKFSWRDPETKKEHGLGRNRAYAIGEMIRANAYIASKRLSLVERISGGTMSWAAWCDRFESLLAERESKPNTVRTRKSQMVRLRRSFAADRPAAKVTTKDCAAVLAAIKAEGKHRTAQAFRSFLVDCFDCMKAEGVLTGDNPARITAEVRVKVRRARLPFEAFMKLYETTSIRWLRNAMALALVAGKDRDSVRNAQFSDYRDGGWWNERSKTEGRVYLPLRLRLRVFGMSLEDVVKQCRATGIASRYLIHQTERAKGATLGKPIHPDKLTRVFSAELAKLNIDWGDKEPATFHEIRSLAARLYKEQGDINPQDLLSHKDPKSTALYIDGRGEWLKLSVPE